MRLVPHEGSVSLRSDGHTLVHAKTGESLLLPARPAPWKLHFTTAGLAFVSNNSPQDRLWVHQLLWIHLYANDDGTIANVVVKRPGTPSDSVLVQGNWGFHPLGARSLVLQAEHLQERRLKYQRLLVAENGAFVFFDLKHIHSDAGFQASQFPGTWVKHGLKTWVPFAEQCIGLPESHLKKETLDPTQSRSGEELRPHASALVSRTRCVQRPLRG